MTVFFIPGLADKFATAPCRTDKVRGGCMLVETEQAVALGRGDFVALTPQWLSTQCAGGRCQRSGGRGGRTHRLELISILGDTPRDVLLVPLALRVR